MEHIKTKIPSLEEATALLKWAGMQNPGRWTAHSQYAAIACQNIAQACPNLDPNIAYRLGLLHDIGRYVGVVRARHQIEGYRLMMEHGWDDAARICLTHTNPLKNVDRSADYFDIPPVDIEFMREYVEQIEFDEYDRLVQLADYLALPNGFCVIEKRMIDVALRYGVDEYAVIRWKKMFEIKKEFDQKAGKNIYCVLPGLFETTIQDFPR